MPSDAYIEVAPMDILGESGDVAYGEHTPYYMSEIFSVEFQTAALGKDDDAAATNDPETKKGSCSITKPIDKSSPMLFRYCCEKKAMDWAIIYIREAGETDQIPWLRLEFRQVYVKDFHWSINPGEGGDDANKAESLTLEFETMLIIYNEQQATGRHAQSVTSSNFWNFAHPGQTVDPVS